MTDRMKIYVVGEVILDIAPAFLGGPYKTLEECMQPGRATLVGECRIYVGAMGNTALALKKLGGDPVLVGRVGDDTFGRIFKTLMDEQQVENCFIVDKSAHTPYTMAVSVPGLDRLFLYNPDAAWKFSQADVTDEMMREAKILHYGYPTALKRMFLDGGAESVELLKRAKENGAVTSMDICFIDEMEEGPHQDWNLILKRVAPYLDIFAPSAEELMYYIDRENYFCILQEAGEKDYLDVMEIQRDIEPLVDRLLGWGCRIVMIKCGKRGIFLKTASEERIREMAARLPIQAWEWGSVTAMQDAYLVKHPVSTAGAGDTTIAAFLLALTRGYNPGTALKLAAKTGARCVMSQDSTSNLIPLTDLINEIDC